MNYVEENGEILPPDEGVFSGRDTEMPDFFHAGQVAEESVGEVIDLTVDPLNDDDARQASRDGSNHPVFHEPTKPSSPRRKRPYEMPGQNRGRSNGLGLPTRKEVVKGLTPHEIDNQDRINKTGAAAARAALGGA